MSLTLVRIESNEPNITNDMDIRAFKYASTGYDGVVANYLNECGYSYSGSTLTIKSGEIIVDGWQVDISAAGEDFTFNSITGTCYYTVYLEIDLSVSTAKTVEIKSTYSTTEYPTVDDGDDISVTTTGVRNFTLYHCEVDSGTISAVESCFDLIDGTVKNATLVQNVDLSSSDEASFGDYVIERKKLIYSSDDGATTYTFDAGEKFTGRTFEIEFGYVNSTTNCGDKFRTRISGKLTSNAVALTFPLLWNYSLDSGSVNNFARTELVVSVLSSTSQIFWRIRTGIILVSDFSISYDVDTYKIYKIYEII